MTRKLILTALVAAFGSTQFPTTILGDIGSAKNQLASTELNSLSFATSSPLTSLPLFDEQSDGKLAPLLLPAETPITTETIHANSPRRQDAAEQLGNWLVVAGFGLSFTVGLIITIAMTRPTTTLPRPLL